MSALQIRWSCLAVIWLDRQKIVLPKHAPPNFYPRLVRLTMSTPRETLRTSGVGSRFQCRVTWGIHLIPSKVREVVDCPIIPLVDQHRRPHHLVRLIQILKDFWIQIFSQSRWCWKSFACAAYLSGVCQNKTPWHIWSRSFQGNHKRTPYRRETPMTKMELGSRQASMRSSVRLGPGGTPRKYLR